jgi:ribosomal protein L21
VQVKSIRNIFNKIKAEKVQILRNRCPFRQRRSPGHQKDMSKIELSMAYYCQNN